MCAQNADVCTELKHESVTAVKPRKSKRGFSHAVAHNVGRTRIRIKGNEPIFDISLQSRCQHFPMTAHSPQQGCSCTMVTSHFLWAQLHFFPPRGACPHLSRCIFSPQDCNRATCALQNLDFELIVKFSDERSSLATKS